MDTDRTETERDRASVVVDPSLLASEQLTVWGLFTEVHASIEQLIGRAAAEYEVSLPWFEVLLRLGRTPGHRIRMTELAEQISFSDSGLSRLADRMERAGHIERVLCRTDRRGTEAVLTRPGAEVLDGAARSVLEVIERELVAPLSERQLNDLERLMRRLRDRPEA